MTSLWATTTAYRQKVLRPNGVIFERSAKALPEWFQDVLQRCDQEAPHDTQHADKYPKVMTHEQTARLIDGLECSEAEPEGRFCKLLSKEVVFPTGDQVRGLCCVEGMPWKADGFPRTCFTDRYSARSAPKPYYAYGYNDSAFNKQQQAGAQSPLYESTPNCTGHF